MLIRGVIIVIVVFTSSLWTGVGNSLAQAEVLPIYTNDSFLYSYHDAPVSFTQDEVGNFSGVTETGKNFQQNIVFNSLSIRLHRFSIDEAFFYVSDHGLIWADTDTVALSIYLARLA